ncbi:MAG: PRC-barrel domain-containing protein [Pirellulales bacterium]
MTTIAKIACLVLCLFPATAISLFAAEPLPRTQDKAPVGELNEPELGPVRSARSLIGMKVVNSSGTAVGVVEDVSLDIGKGTIRGVALAAQTTTPDLKAETLAVPAPSLKFQSGEKKTLVMEKLVEQPKPDATKANSESHLLFVGKTPSIEVRNKAGKRLGEITDFAIALERDRIAYAVLSLDGETPNSDTKAEFYPIPLAAFVVDHDAKSWILELPPKLLDDTPTFGGTNFPTKISGVWTEYVHVRYGRTILGGVQEETRKERVKE